MATTKSSADLKRTHGWTSRQVSDLNRTLRIIEQSSGGDGCPICGWIWWTGAEPCASCEREKQE